MGRIAAFQADDPGSIPGQRKFSFWNFLGEFIIQNFLFTFQKVFWSSGPYSSKCSMIKTSKSYTSHTCIFKFLTFLASCIDASVV